MYSFAQTLAAPRYYRRLGAQPGRTGMLSAAECRAHAEEKLAQADRDDLHRKRLIIAAEAWLILASQMRRLETQLGTSD
jgi:hypothetical protein